ncbi:hypothetical protein [Intrasporangium sp. DVR]|uniref:hypothetical protein n=1 Tax=Intrasporangium sp. DVR TaxID=3127867 RepID=UPI00313A5FCE
MNALRTGTLAASAALLAGGVLTAAPAAAAPATTSSHTTTISGTPCRTTSIHQIGTKKVVWDKGMAAFTVRQYLGYCRDARGWAWMNVASTYVWQQYHVRGFGYRAQVGIAVKGEDETRGYVIGANRQRLTWSKPVRTVNLCTRGWGKLSRLGSESAQGMTSLRC